MARKRIVANMTIQEQADEILRRATEKGVSSNFFFVTTFKRYQVQLKMCADLESEIKKCGTMVSKEYVKGRGNLYTNPAISEYCKVSTAANATVSTLISIIEKLAEESVKENKFMQLMQELE